VIDFRYHLVSIIAVFLALAVGIVVGSTALKPSEVSALRAVSAAVKKDNEALHQNIGDLQKQTSADQVFAQAASGRLLSRLLAGQRVVLVTAPGADGPAISGITAAAQQAGATVTGQVSLAQLFFDTSAGTESSLNALAQQLAPSAAAASQAGDSQIAGQQAAARVIASALVTRDATGASTTQDAQSAAILSGFSQQGFLQVSNTAAGTLEPATLAVVIAPATPPDNDASPANLGLIAVAQALRAASHGVVLAGSLAGSGPGSAIDALSSGVVGAPVTTVDDADTETGQIVVVWGLDELLAGAKPAAYGVRPDVVPSPAPSPSASVTVQPTPAATASKSSGKGSSGKGRSGRK